MVYDNPRPYEQHLGGYSRARRVLNINDSRARTITNGQTSWRAAPEAALSLAGFAIFIFIAGPIHRLLPAVHLDLLFRFLRTDATRLGAMPMIFYLLLLGGPLLAWLKGFPRWSYPYLGWLMVILVSGLGISALTGPYLRLIWGPFLVTLLLAILLNPSLKSLKALWRNWRWDWTLASFALFGILEFLVWAGFDEMPGPGASRAFWQLLSLTVLVAGVRWYMRASGKAGRITALLGSAALSVALSMGVMVYYWHNFPKPYIQPPLTGDDLFAAPPLVLLAVVVAFLLAPALLSATPNRLFPHHSTG